MEDALLNTSTASDAMPQPHDRYHLAFFILYLQGVGCLFPWNAFITKTDYYALAFRGSEYAASFASIVTTTFTLIGLVTILWMQRVQHLSSTRARLIFGLTLQLCVFLVIFAFSAAPLALPAAHLSSFLQRTRTSLFAVTVAGVALAGFAQACTPPVHPTRAPHPCTAPVHHTVHHIVHPTCAPHPCTAPVHRTRAPHHAPHPCTTKRLTTRGALLQAVITGSLFTYATLYARPTYLQASSVL